MIFENIRGCFSIKRLFHEVHGTEDARVSVTLPTLSNVFSFNKKVSQFEGFLKIKVSLTLLKSIKQCCLKEVVLETHPPPRRQFGVLCEKNRFVSRLSTLTSNLVTG